MYDYQSALVRIAQMRAENGSTAVRSAIMECRLALEAMAYDRLDAAKKYANPNELDRWRPKQVIDYLTEEINDKAFVGYELSIAKGEPEFQTVAAYKALEWVKLGDQPEFNTKKLVKLWHQTSSFLHYRHQPETDAELLEKLNRCCDEAAGFIADGTDGNLIGSFIPQTISFTCVCGSKVSRNEERLKNEAIVRCNMPECFETYTCHKDNEDFTFERRASKFACTNCIETITIPGHFVDRLRGDQYLIWQCACGQHGYGKFEMKLFSKKAPRSRAGPS